MRGGRPVAEAIGIEVGVLQRPMAVHGVVVELGDRIARGAQRGLVHVVDAIVMHIGIVDERQRLVVMVMVAAFSR